MREVLFVVLMLISVAIVTLILLQQRGSGVGAALGSGGGGGGEVYRSQRGVEKIFHYLTIVLAFLYAGISLGLIFVA